jgi:hypothetical protein
VELRDYLNRIPEHETLAEFCQKVETFRELRPQAVEILPIMCALDELIWAKELAGRLPQVSLDLFAAICTEMSIYSGIDERLNEEKQKLPIVISTISRFARWSCLITRQC